MKGGNSRLTGGTHETHLLKNMVEKFSSNDWNLAAN
jgi:hypothetical protein